MIYPHQQIFIHKLIKKKKRKKEKETDLNEGNEEANQRQTVCDVTSGCRCQFKILNWLSGFDGN